VLVHYFQYLRSVGKWGDFCKDFRHPGVGKVREDRVGYPFLMRIVRMEPPPSSRDSLDLQAFRKQHKNVERELEKKKLAALIERVKRQLAAREMASGPRVA
jgi:hypothetical protein